MLEWGTQDSNTYKDLLVSEGVLPYCVDTWHVVWVVVSGPFFRVWPSLTPTNSPVQSTML